MIQAFLELRGPVTVNSSKLAVLAYSGQFCMLLITDFGSCRDPNVSGTPGSGYGELVKTRSFSLYRPVLYAINTDFGTRCDPDVSGTPGSDYGELIKTRSFGLFQQVLYAISH